MKIHTILEQADSSVQQLIDVVKKGAYAIAQVGILELPLYRGLSVDDLFVDVRVPTQQRSPRDTLPAIHHALDDLMHDAFGVRYRSTAVFATGMITVAKEYGTPYLLIPFGRFKFCWSNGPADDALNYFSIKSFINAIKTLPDYAEHKDEFLSTDFATATTPNSQRELLQRAIQENHPIVKPAFMKWMKNMFTTAQYEEGNYVEAQSSGHEIMISCEEYAVISLDDPSPQLLQELNQRFNTTEFTEAETILEVLDAVASNLGLF